MFYARKETLILVKNVMKSIILKIYPRIYILCEEIL